MLAKILTMNKHQTIYYYTLNYVFTSYPISTIIIVYNTLECNGVEI
jgi:hypothetical protein